MERITTIYWVLKRIMWGPRTFAATHGDMSCAEKAIRGRGFTSNLISGNATVSSANRSLPCMDKSCFAPCFNLSSLSQGSQANHLLA
jgi:hypothetical protein